METKSQAFQRLAGKRVEAIEDALRIFGNLAGPSYDWTPAEVLAYAARIEAGLAAALARFRENRRRWPAEAPAPETPIAAPVVLDPAPPAAETGDKRRRLAIGQVLAAAQAEGPAVLAEQLVLQREVIEALQARLDGARP